MPLYEYRCTNCHATFEVLQRAKDKPPQKCPKCGGGPVVKLISSPAIQFKGNGWYITDYAKKNTPSPEPKPAEKAKNESAKEPPKEPAKTPSSSD